jgi:hypothetical protein
MCLQSLKCAITARVVLGLALLCTLVASASLGAQTIRVDITPQHVTNRFVPTEALGAGIDRISKEAIDKSFNESTLKEIFTAGWQPVTYRLNTELLIEAWHWNPDGTWSDAAGGVGYFTGSATPREAIRYSYGYGLPHRGVTRNDGTDNAGFSRLTDGDQETYWKSNPYLTQRFTGESDASHPQWIVIDLTTPQPIDSIRIAWTDPYATKFLVQYWTGEDPIRSPTRGAWLTFPRGDVPNGKGKSDVLRLAPAPISVRFVRIWMTESSNTCDTHGPADPRNCAGYAIRELYLGTTTADQVFHDIVRHTPDQEQTTTFCSSVDPWHRPSDLSGTKQAQVGFDLFYTSGVTRGLPAMVPVALLYDTPDNAAALIAYLEKRHYPISYVEMGEEPDGQYMLPEDYGALYLQWATALHRVDPALKLGGPSFQGVNKDIEVWPDSSGRVSWTRRFLDYLKQHGRLSDLKFFSFEHYPLEPCRITWAALYDEPGLVSNILDVWRQDGVPSGVPMFITESNLAAAASETYMDIFGGLWLADYIGSFLSAGGNAAYYFHYLPLPMERGCNESPGTFGMFKVDPSYRIQQPLSQYFASQMINLEWAQPGNGVHQVFPAKSDIEDGAGHVLVTAYALHRPDGRWSLMIVNRDQENAHSVKIAFHNATTSTDEHFTGDVDVAVFGKEQYVWRPARTIFMAHAEHDLDAPVVVTQEGTAIPDGPVVRRTKSANPESSFELPAASIVVLRGSLGSS